MGPVSVKIVAPDVRVFSWVVGELSQLRGAAIGLAPSNLEPRASSETPRVRMGAGKGPGHHLVLGFPNWVNIRIP